jgi:branched-chain amino acid transport system ATP-binding protein
VLEIENLYAGYGQGDVLFDLSFSVGKGEAVCLLGRNGAGKSTTLKAIMNLVRPRAGEIRFDGSSVTNTPSNQIALRGIGYVPEERRMFPSLTVEENLRVPRTKGKRNDGWSLDRVYDLFPVLRERRRQAAGTLSGGEQQMLAIGRTLMGNPTLLLLDEPSEGLAPLVIQELIEQIRRLKEEALTILLSEQNLAFAELLCERVYVIDRGGIMFTGSLAELRDDESLQAKYLSVGTGPGDMGHVRRQASLT